MNQVTSVTGNTDIDIDHRSKVIERLIIVEMFHLFFLNLFIKQFQLIVLFYFISNMNQKKIIMLIN